MGPCRTAMLLMLAASQATAQPAETASARRVFVPPPVQWDHAMLTNRPALQQTATDFANLTGGIVFGMSPAAANARLPEPRPGMSWNALSLANEYPGEVRFFRVPIGAAGSLRMDLTACTGAGSYVMFLFNSNGLVRLSYRLLADKTCDDATEAARHIFARYVTIGQSVALSARYRTGNSEVLDLTDPIAGDLVPVHWRQGGN